MSRSLRFTLHGHITTLTACGFRKALKIFGKGGYRCLFQYAQHLGNRIVN